MGAMVSVDIKVCSVFTSTTSMTEIVLLSKMASVITLIPYSIDEFPTLQRVQVMLLMQLRPSVKQAVSCCHHATFVSVSVTFVHL